MVRSAMLRKRLRKRIENDTELRLLFDGVEAELSRLKI